MELHTRAAIRKARVGWAVDEYTSCVGMLGAGVRRSNRSTPVCAASQLSCSSIRATVGCAWPAGIRLRREEWWPGRDFVVCQEFLVQQNSFTLEGQEGRTPSPRAPQIKQRGRKRANSKAEADEGYTGSGRPTGIKHATIEQSAGIPRRTHRKLSQQWHQQRRPGATPWASSLLTCDHGCLRHARKGANAVHRFSSAPPRRLLATGVPWDSGPVLFVLLVAGRRRSV